MKISEITDETLLKHCNAYEEDLDLLKIYKESAIKYIKDYTWLEDLDKYEDITLAYLNLISEMYDNRALTVDSNKSNNLVTSILNMHTTNLL